MAGLDSDFYTVKVENHQRAISMLNYKPSGYGLQAAMYQQITGCAVGTTDRGIDWHERRRWDLVERDFEREYMQSPALYLVLFPEDNMTREQKDKFRKDLETSLRSGAPLELTGKSKFTSMSDDWVRKIELSHELEYCRINRLSSGEMYERLIRLT